MQKLSGKNLLLVGFTLFSMFFGAGNLIFPPHLGAQAGTSLWPAFAGLAVSAVGLPIAGVVAVARAGGLDKLAGRVHPVFAMVFTILVYLSIGPCLAIPRTASTSFQMLVPLVGGGTGLQLAYSVLFFAAAFLVALRPEKLSDWLGRILCPCLIVLIVVLFAGCLIHPLAAHYGTPSAEYAALPAVQGILYGYQTMDTLAGLNFGAVIALNIRARGVTESRAVEGGTIRAGFIAGGLMLVVYAMLGHAGAETGTVYPGLATGAEVLTALAQQLFGRAGLVLIAAILVIMRQHLRGPDRLCGAVFSSAAAPHPLPCPCRLFCCGQYAGIEPRPCCHHPAVHSGAERHLSRSHRADPAFLYAGP